MQFVLVFIFFITLLIAALTLQNQEPMEITLFFWTFSVSKILVILSSAFTGALAVFLAGLFQRLLRMNKEKAGQEKEKPEGKPPAAPGSSAAPATDSAAPAANGDGETPEAHG